MADLLTREVKFTIRAVNEDEGEFDFIGATEAPVDMGLDAPEVLRVDGMDFDAALPLLDAHKRFSSSCVLGRAFPRKEGRQLAFRVKFSKATQAARDACALVKDRSIDSCSIGYLIQEYREIREGEVDGEGEAAARGPCYVVTKSRVKELSIVPIGADPNARRRAFGAKEIVMKIKANPGETREQFLARALADAEFTKEIPDEAKRRAVVDRLWAEAQPKPPATPAKPEATRQLDDELAAELEARARLIRSRCPMDLREYLDKLLLDEPMIGPDVAWGKLREERARRMVPGGTPEPKGAKPAEGKPGAPAAPAGAPPPPPDATEGRSEIIGLIRGR